MTHLWDRDDVFSSMLFCIFILLLLSAIVPRALCKIFFYREYRIVTRDIDRGIRSVCPSVIWCCWKQSVYCTYHQTFHRLLGLSFYVLSWYRLVMVISIGADTVLKLGGHKLTNAQNCFSVPPNLRCVPQFRGTAGAYHSGKTDIVKITRVKKQRHCWLAD